MLASIKLLPWQREFLEDPHRVKILIAGRQSGKSHALYAGLSKVCSASRGRSAVILPVQSQANDFFKTMVAGDNFESLLLGEPKIWPYPVLTFRSGHTLEFRSFEKPKRLRGGKWTGLVCVDEANDLEGDDILRVCLLKTAATNAQILVTSTVTEPNWLWDKFLEGQSPNPMIKSWLYTVEHGFPFRGTEGRKRLEDLRSITPKYVWDSEMLCMPSASQANAFPYWDGCLVESPPPKGPSRSHSYLIGLDLGRQRDGEVAVVGDEEGQVVDYLAFPMGSEALAHEIMAARVAALSRHWGNAGVVIDSTGKGGAGGQLVSGQDSHVEVYRRALGDNARLREFYWSGNRDNETKAHVIQNLMLMTEQKRLKCHKASFAELDVQMRQYRILKNRGSASTFGPKPKSGHNDDAVAALAQLAWGMREDWFERAGGQGVANAFL